MEPATLGQHLAVGSKDSLVSLWQLDEFLPLRTLGAHATALRSLSFSPCGSMVSECVSVSERDREGESVCVCFL